MKKLTIIVALVAAGGVYKEYWNNLTENLKKAIHVSTGADSNFFLKYEEISCKGFPFKVEAVIKNPLLVTRTSTPLEQISTEGTWTIGTQVFRRILWWEIDGKTEVDPSQDDGWTLTGNVRVEFPPPKERIDTKKLQSESPIELLKLVSKAEGSFQAKNLSLTCGNDKQPLFEVDSWTFLCEKVKAAPGYTEARQINVDLKGYQVDQKALARLIYQQPELASMVGQSRGKSDLSGKMRFQCCPDEKVSPISFELEKMSYRSELGDRGSAQGKCAISDVQSSGYKGEFSLQMMQEFSSQSHTYMLSNFRSLFQQWNMMGHFASCPQWGNLFVDHWDQVATLFPDYSSWRPIEMQIDLGFQVRKKGTPEEELKIDLKNCLFKTAAHEIVLKGSKNFADPGAISFFELQVPHYHQFLQDLGDYYNRWQSVLTSTQTVSEQEMAKVTGKAVDRIASFLELLSQPKGKDLHIIVEGSSWDDMTVGSLNTEVLSSEIQKLVVDVVEEMAPPTGVKI